MYSEVIKKNDLLNNLFTEIALLQLRETNSKLKSKVIEKRLIEIMVRRFTTSLVKPDDIVI